ncbi:hypothetical protein SLA_7062 [Streptomyces laurentii]|uniref:Uncharacterized protein n=1 Tax=Streptomyces laurentii TaxID=39478 RepID=A0A169PI46_STRLU|nr:hypothetical protein SLA_7062 [Streptomyces laurentii]
MNDHDVKTLLEVGLHGEPPLRTSVETVVTAGRRSRVRRRGALAGVGLTAGVAVAALALVVPGAGPGATPSAAADPLVGPLVPAAADSAAPRSLRPDTFGPGTEHTTRWSSERLAATLVGLLPPGGATVSEADIPGRTYRVQWDGGTGPVEFVGGAEYTAKAPRVPLCASITMPKVAPRPGAPAPRDTAPASDCRVVELADGARAEAVTLRFPRDGQSSSYVRVLRKDGRTVSLQQWTGRPDAEGAPGTRSQPQLDTTALLKIANDPAWTF